jgi:enoyl-CoA hydratase
MPPSDFETLQLKRAGFIAQVQLNRPERYNALNRQMLRDLDAVCAILERAQDVRAVVISGNGKSFAAGADITELQEMTVDEIDRQWAGGCAVYERIQALPQAVIAAIHGYALGGGLLIALSADVLIAARDAKLGFPEIKLGFFPGNAGTVLIEHLAGPVVARAMCITGDPMDAERCLTLGLLHALYAPEALQDEAYALAVRLASYRPAAITLTKQVLSGCVRENYDASKRHERDLYRMLFESPDGKAGIDAFLARRTAKTQ